MNEGAQRHLIALGSMLAGSLVVFSAVILINHASQNLEDVRAEAREQIKFERKKPPQEQQVQKPKPKPRPRRTPHAPPAPLTGLDTSLSGVDMGIPGFSANDLMGMDGDLLGDGSGMVMTDETVDQAPRATFQSPMEYPPRARAQGVEGYVVLSLLIGLTGEIEQIEVVESYPEGTFDEAAVAGVRQWQFDPALYQGQAVRAWARQRVRFDLGG
ncbi:MAG: TonB family protein [Xanthomonadales bacterium]|nr:TonB family protein [Xanthomonadales bacterium]